MTLLTVSHRQQTQQADCLAACAAMVLDYLHIPISYNKLTHLNDPDLSTAPQAVSIAEFELAWLEKDYLVAVIQLA